MAECSKARGHWTVVIASYDDEEIERQLGRFPIFPHHHYNAHDLRVWEQMVRREARKRGLL